MVCFTNRFRLTLVEDGGRGEHISDGEVYLLSEKQELLKEQLELSWPEW